jgi:hypothetical protein
MSSSNINENNLNEEHEDIVVLSSGRIHHYNKND